MISQETIDKVNDEDIIDIISDFITLKKKGANFVANCPFHQEKSGSFTVNPVKQIYKCFGCGKGGNAVRFVMDHESYSYPDAIKYVADKYGIEYIKEDETPEQRNKGLERDSIIKANEFATKYFTDNLTSSKEAKKYLSDRGLIQDKIEKLQIGFAPDEYRGLYDHLTKLGFSKEVIINSGLCYQNEERIIDRFRGRITFPVHNLTGRIVGFSARILTADKTKPKYVNTPETEVYHKREQLYGLFLAKKAMTDQSNAFLVEGNMDVAALINNGIDNSIASSGTSLSTEQIRSIKRFTENITVIFDGDSAGRKAAARGMAIILEQGMKVKSVVMPDGEDPDSLLYKHGPNYFRDYVEKNKGDLIDIFYDGWSSMTGEQKDEVIKEVTELISKIPEDNQFYRDEHITKAARLFRLDTNRFRHNVVRRQEAVTAKQESLHTEPIEEEQPIVLQHEVEFAGALILHGHKTYFADKPCFHYMFSKAGTQDDFLMEVPRKIFNAYYAELILGNIPNLDFFLKHKDPQIADFAQTLSFDTTTLSESWGSPMVDNDEHITIVKNIVGYFRICKYKELSKQNQLEMANETDDDKIDELMLKDRDIKTLLQRECQELGINTI